MTSRDRKGRDKWWGCGTNCGTPLKLGLIGDTFSAIANPHHYYSSLAGRYRKAGLAGTVSPEEKQPFRRIRTSWSCKQ
jgi:hypothetical protein